MSKFFSRMVPRMAVAVFVSTACAASAQDIGRPVLHAPEVPLTHSVEQADAKLAEVAAARARVNQAYAADEQVCNDQFFVNHCLDAAKEKRRLALSGLRAVEVEANRYKRQAAVDKRDAELADRLKKDAEEEARRAAAPHPPQAERSPAERSPAAPAAKPGPSPEQRQAEHDAKERRRLAQEAADAPRRAEKVAAFEKKQAESEQRRARIAERMADRAEKARKRAEAAAAKAEAAAAAAKAAAARDGK